MCYRGYRVNGMGAGEVVDAVALACRGRAEVSIEDLDVVNGYYVVKMTDQDGNWVDERVIIGEGPVDKDAVAAIVERALAALESARRAYPKG